jgi:hypothetical protein
MSHPLSHLQLLVLDRRAFCVWQIRCTRESFGGPCCVRRGRSRSRIRSPRLIRRLWCRRRG